MRKTLAVFMTLFFPLLSCVGVVYGVDKNDWLGQSYQYSHENPSGDPYSSDVEADDLFNTNASYSTSEGAGLSDSVLVRAARFMMRIAVMLAIPILIFGGIKVALSFGDKGKVMEALKQVGLMLAGLFLILASVILVLFITSITRSSLDLFQGDLG